MLAKNLPYSETAKETYKLLCSKIPVPKELMEWSRYMQAKYGDTVKVHQSIYSNWLIVLLIVRYGENESYWPSSYSEADIQRAASWFHGNKPEGVHYMEGAYSDRSILKMGTMAFLFALGAYLIDPSLILGVPIIIGTALTDAAENDMINGFHRTGLTTIPTWAATTVYSLGDVVKPTAFADRLYRAVIAGTSGGVQPTFSTAIGTETTDNTVTWQTNAVGPLKVPMYWALYTAAPGETGGGTEVTGGAYARAAAQPLDANYNAPSGGTGVTANTNDITFPAPVGANWGTVVSFASLDRASGTANMFSFGSLTVSRVINDGDQAPKFPAGDLTLTWA